MPLPSPDFYFGEDDGKESWRRQRKNAVDEENGTEAGYNRTPRSAAMTTFSEYMAQYDHEHGNRWNKALHGIGIPVIIAGIALLCLTFWRTGAALFVGGWVLLFLGHRIEGNKPAFFQGVIYFLVGPVWIAKEIKEALLGRSTAHGPHNQGGRARKSSISR
jgi:hypothetical protein